MQPVSAPISKMDVGMGGIVLIRSVFIASPFYQEQAIPVCA
jgi:hypothetical protein